MQVSKVKRDLRFSMGICLLVTVVSFFAVALSACASEIILDRVESALETFRVVRVTGGLEHPWSMAFLPDGRILVTERPGRLRIIDRGKLIDKALAGIPPVAAKGQGGLLDLTLHPDFGENGWVYFSYAGQAEGGIGTEVARGRLKEDRLEDVQVIFRLLPKTGETKHFGSRLVFDGQKRLYISLGDRGERDRAQDLGDHAGSMIRLTDEGRIPEDNPFVGRSGVRPEIYSYGHRNMQGAARHPETGEIWTHEHGPQGGDEINLIRPGVNYGWPVITYGVNYVIGTSIGEGTHKEGMAQPLYTWVPSIAPSGMSFYTADKFPGWKGDLFVGALKDEMLVRLRLDGYRIASEERLLENRIGRIRAVEQGTDGFLYLLTDEADGGLYRLEPIPSP